jgi:drug/metabolite transporter (DMT)-like permease
VIYLLLVSIIWAFSFGLIKGQLSGLDTNAVAAVRLLISAAIFLPFLKLKQIPRGAALRLIFVGMIEFGAMYMLYLRAYRYLMAHEVALFAIATPLYLAVLETLAAKRWYTRLAVSALLAVLGAGVVSWQNVSSSRLITGLLLMQASNLCFAAGQFFYRKVRPTAPEAKDVNLFALLYLGAVAVALSVTVSAGSWNHFSPSPQQWFVLGYLGVVASGLCFFWWNLGATRVNAATLAAFNDAKVPLGVACSLLFFHEHADINRLVLGGVLMLAAIAIAERGREKV